MQSINDYDDNRLVRIIKRIILIRINLIILIWLIITKLIIIR